MTRSGSGMGSEAHAEQLENLVERAAEAATAGDVDSVLALSTIAVQVGPDDPRGWSLLAAAQLEKGDSAAAEISARRALRLDGNDAYSKYLLGGALFEQGKADEARGWLIQAHAELGDADSAIGVARCSLAVQCPEEALAVLEGVTSEDARLMSAVRGLRMVARHDLVLAEHWAADPTQDGRFHPTGPVAVREMKRVVEEAEHEPIEDDGVRQVLESVKATLDDALSRRFAGRWAMGVFPILLGVLMTAVGSDSGEWPIAVLGVLYVLAGAAYFHAARYYTFELNAVWMSGKGDTFDRIADGVDKVVKGAERIHWALSSFLAIAWLGVMVSIAVYGLPLVLLYHYVRQSRVRRALALS